MIHEETVGTYYANGEMVVALGRRFSKIPLSPSELTFAEHLCPEAFEKHGEMLCVPRHVAALLALDFGLVCNELADLERRFYDKGEMLTSGWTARMVLECANQRGLDTAILYNVRQLDHISDPNLLVVAIRGKHMYFCKGRVRQKLLDWNSNSATQKLRRVHRSSTTTSAASKWVPWNWKLSRAISTHPKKRWPTSALCCWAQLTARA